MRIVVSHLTRMRQGYMCVAGVVNGSHKRPVLEHGQLSRTLLTSEGGPFSLGALVDLGTVELRPNAPEVEDVVFYPEHARYVRHLKAEEFFEKSIESMSKSSVKEVFGEELEKRYTASAAVPIGIGSSSLGIVGPLEKANIFVDTAYDPKIRLSFADPIMGDIKPSVTDLRLWKKDHRTPNIEIIDMIRERLKGCYIAVGLTRAYKDRYGKEWHWLQVNNVFPVGDPLWSRE